MTIDELQAEIAELASLTASALGHIRAYLANESEKLPSNWDGLEAIVTRMRTMERTANDDR